MLQDFWDKHPGLYGIWYEVTELKFISDFFDWIFKFMARLAEPLMFISILYAITKVTLPHVVAGMDAWAGNSSMAILNNAPEAIMPSCFMAAAKAFREGNKRVMWLYGVMGCAFLILTLITMGLFVGAANPGADKIILFFRCAMGVLYSVLVRVFAERKENVRVVRTVQVSAKMEEVQTSLATGLKNIEGMIDGVKAFHSQEVARINERLSESETRFQLLLNERLSESETRFQLLLNERLSESETLVRETETGLQEYINESIAPLIEGLSLLPSTLAEQLAYMSEVPLNLRTITEEVTTLKVTLAEQIQIRATPALPVHMPTQITQARVEATPKAPRAVSRTPLQLAPRQEIGAFDIKSFVYECLDRDSDVTIPLIIEAAGKLGQTVSVGSISKYRKQYREEHIPSMVIEMVGGANESEFVG